ncbi:MAG: L-threonylcarbamoyladenylate synthase [Syntrophales bacterium]|nr:L-threonylcarbamoyladenylate synthase [Syntrophales bacterium]
MSPLIIPVDPLSPSEDAIDEAAELLREGKVIAYPTETFYGIGADGTNENAVDRIFTIKGRKKNLPISLIIGELIHLEPLIKALPEAGKRIIRAFWPGAVTILFEASPAVSTKLTAGTGKIGIRLSSHPLATLLASRLGGPLTATSANRSGEAECSSAEEVLALLGDDMDAVIDGGRAPGPPGSTIIDVTMESPRILREGAVTAEKIAKILKGS